MRVPRCPTVSRCSTAGASSSSTRRPRKGAVEDVRRAYEAKVPMGRGCTPADVLEALYYLVAQQYETGQALPVTGGQVMLS